MAAGPHWSILERAGGDIGSLPGYGGGSRNDYGAGPEEYHEGWKDQNPGEHPAESPYFEDLHPKAQQRELDEYEGGDFSQAGHPGYGGPLGPEHSMENTEAFKNYRPGPNPYEAKVLKTAGYKQAWGETEAPPEVDTLRPEGSAPEDDNDDYHEFVNPADTEFANNNESPQELLTRIWSRPGTSIASRTRRSSRARHRQEARNRLQEARQRLSHR